MGRIYKSEMWRYDPGHGEECYKEAERKLENFISHKERQLEDSGAVGINELVTLVHTRKACASLANGRCTLDGRVEFYRRENANFPSYSGTLIPLYTQDFSF